MCNGAGANGDGTFGAVSAWTLHVAMREDFLSESRLYVEEKRGFEMVSAMLPPHVVATLRRLGPRAGDWAGLVSDAEPAVTIVFVDILDLADLEGTATGVSKAVPSTDVRFTAPDASAATNEQLSAANAFARPCVFRHAGAAFGASIHADTCRAIAA